MARAEAARVVSPTCAAPRGAERRRPIDNLPVIVLGLLLGMRHATDPDHVIAVTTIVSRQRTTRGAALIGSLWGIGHTVTIMLVGGVIILFDVAIPPRLGLTMEFGVALMLIVLGIVNVAAPWRRATSMRPAREGLHAHHHGHDDYVHRHAHGHEPGFHGHAEDQTPLSRVDGMLGQLGVYQVMRPLVVGLVHGLAGSAAVALLVLATIRNPLWALAYLLLFGVGTVVGMMLITAVIAVPFAYTAGRFATVNRYLGVASGLLSLAVGLFLVYEIGLVDGLFTSNPRWTPK
jgi:high-affinity nickel-transport protein